MTIYTEGEKLGLDAPLTEFERKEIEALLNKHNKHSSTHRALVRLLCAEKHLQDENNYLEKRLGNALFLDIGYEPTPKRIFDI